MIKLEINEKEYRVPESFDELDFETYSRVFYGIDTESKDDELLDFRRLRENEAIIISRILGEADDFCFSLPLQLYVILREKTSFIYDLEGFLSSAKAGITIDGKRYQIPPMNEMQLRQYIDADVVMKGDDNPLKYIELLSVLLLSRDKDGKWIPYDGNYQEMMGRLRKMKSSEVLPLVYHFFKKSRFLAEISKVSMKEGVTVQ